MLVLDLSIPEDLAPWLERISLLTLDAREQFPIFAGARVHLGFVDRGEIFLHRSDAIWSRDQPACWGASASFGSVSAGDHGARCILLKLAAGAPPALFGCSAETCTEQVLALNKLWPWLKSAPTSTNGLALLDHALTQLRRAIHHNQSRQDWQAARCHAAMRALDVLPVNKAADFLAISRITLERQIRKSFGIPPKSLARIQRFYRALNALPQTEAAAIATDTGYYDQSHMIAEFRSMGGHTPATLRELVLSQPDRLRLYESPAGDQAGC